MTLGEPIPLSQLMQSSGSQPAEKLLSLGDAVPAESLRKPAAPEAPTLGQPLDVLAPDSPREFFVNWKSQQPDIGLMEHVKEAGSSFFSGLGHAAKTLVGLAVTNLTSYGHPATSVEALKKDVATASEIGSEMYKQSAAVGSFVKSKLSVPVDTPKAWSAPTAKPIPGYDQYVKDAAVDAEKGFLRDVRDLSASSNDGRVMVDALWSAATGRPENPTLGVPVDREGVAFLAGIAADPSIAANLLAKTGLTIPSIAAKQSLKSLPAYGDFVAAQRMVVETRGAVAESEAKVLAAKAAGADAGEFEGQLTKDVSKNAEAVADFNRKLALISRQTEEANRAAVDDFTAQMGPGMTQRTVAGGLKGAGKIVGWAGEKAQAINDKIDDLISHFAGGSADADVLLKSTADRVLPGGSLRRSVAGVGPRFGQFLGKAGTQMAARDSSLPYFQSLARSLPEGSIGRWAASQAERAEFLSSTGRWLMDTTDHAIQGAGVGAAFGALNGDPVGGAVNGGLFGAAGSQVGQLRRWNSAAEVHAQQLVDIQMAADRRATSPNAQAEKFSKLSPGMQLAIATAEQAHPDLNVQLVNEGGKGAAGWYDFNGKVGMLYIDLDHATPLEGLLTHEVKHHLAMNPEIAQAVETKLLGNPDSGVPGLFVERDAAGKPIVLEQKDPADPTGQNVRRSFKLNKDFYDLREEYLQRLRNRKLPTQEYEKDDALIAHELWAEAQAVNVFHRQPNGKFDMLAEGQMNPLQRKIADAVSGSSLVANSAFLQKALAKFGVVFDGFTGRAANTNLFSKTVDVPGLRNAVREYYRLAERDRTPLSDADQRDAQLYTEDEILKNDNLSEIFSSGFDTVRDPVSGKMRFVSEKEARERAQDFVKTLTNELDQYVGNEPGVVKKQEVITDTGRRSVAWIGTKIPESIIQKMEKSGRFNPAMLQNLRMFSEIVANGGKNEVNMLYQPASKRGGRLYRTRPITERTETPMSIRITQDGNVVINTISQEKLQRNAVEAIKAGRATLWGNDYSALWKDIGQYLTNHATGHPGEANGLGVEKRDFINHLFGQLTKNQREFNPFLQDIGEKRARNMGIVQSRRLDRISRAFTTSAEWRPDYRKVSENYSPGVLEEVRVEPVSFSPERLEELKKDPNIVWHGSGSGDLRGGPSGLHVGTFEAAKQALEARIGRPAEGWWDGTREYGKTLLKGAESTDRDVKYGRSGFNVDLPKDDFHPTKKPVVSYGPSGKVEAEMDTNPIIAPFRIVGQMSNSRFSPHEDSRANGLMRGLLKKGTAKRGFYYTNDGEDAGSISATVPNGRHLEQVLYSPGAAVEEPLTRGTGESKGAVHEDAEGNDGKVSFRVDPARRGGDFASAIEAAAKAHKFGAAVEVKPRDFYTDPANKLFLSEDGKSGAAVKPDGDLVSVFKDPSSKADIDPILEEAASHAKKLDGFAINGKLPELYSTYGFRPVARVAFNDEYAPTGWNFEKAGRPDNVFMVRDPENKLGLPDASSWKSAESKVPLVSYDEALKLQQAAVDRLDGKEVPAPKNRDVSSVPVIKGEEKLDLPENPTVLDIARALAARSRAAKRIPFDSRTAGAKEAAANALTDEIVHAVSQDKSAIGWYERKINEAMGHLAEVHPELADDPAKAGFFKAVLAITSNGQAVTDNFKRADELYRGWKETGKLDSSSVWGGARAAQINKGLLTLQKLVDEQGLEATNSFLMSEFRFGDIKKLAKEELEIDLGSSEPADHRVRGAIVFGPKVGGGFFPNLNGDFSPVTMDLWLMRTWNRINGSYGQSDQVAMGRAIDKLRAAASENPEHPDSAAIEKMSDRQLGNWAEKRFADWKNVRKFKDGDAFDRPAKNYAEAKEGAAEAPRNSSERAWIREIFAEIDKKIAERGLPPINNADKQALLWYYEKDLYSSLGYRNVKGKPADYADAAKAVLDSAGK